MNKTQTIHHKRLAVLAAALGVAVFAGRVVADNSRRAPGEIPGDLQAVAADKDDRKVDRRNSAHEEDYYPELKKKIVPIISVGSNLSVGVAQVQGEEADVNRVKVVAQLETDYKDWARIKILVPVSTESFTHIDRVPGVAVSAIADYTIKQ